MQKKLLFFVFFCLTICGCNPQAKDKLLRTFFDGVPVREAKKELPAAKPLAAKETSVIKESKISPMQQESTSAEPVKFLHPPFAEHLCDNCHNKESSQRTGPIRDLCFTCHDDFTKNKKTVHFPVEEGQCTECHDPHQSPNKFMLKKAIPEVCFGCHDEKEVRGNPVHEGISVCTECHTPHASNEEKLLK